MARATPSQTASPGHGISFGAATRTWARIGLLSFGGPAGQIAVMHRILVEEKRWIGEQRFLHALNYCMLLPGPEAQQLACYVGWLLHRTLGGVVAGALFVLPGFLAMLALCLTYVLARDVPAVQALFYGLKPAIIAVVLAAVLRIGRRALRGPLPLLVAALSFVAIAAFQVPFPVIVLAAGIIGAFARRWWPSAASGHAANLANAAPPLIADDALTHAAPSLARSLGVLALWGGLWLVPLAGLAWWLGDEHVLVRLGVFFAQAAALTFGGAYALLAWVAQQAVTVHGWVTPAEMMDGLGLAETTPGPLILVTEFVGFLGAHRQGGAHPLLLGTLGAVVVTWVTFLPSYLWIFLGAPFVEHLRGLRALNAALSGVTAAVVGVILNLALWFALHTIFAEVVRWQRGPLILDLPVLASVDWAALVIALAASVAMLRFAVGMLPVLAASVVLGGAWHLLAR